MIHYAVSWDSFVAIDITIHTGYRAETMKTAGWTHIAEHTFFSGIPGQSLEAADRERYDIFHSISAVTRVDSVHIQALTHRNNLSQASQMLERMLWNSVPEKSDYRIIAREIIDEIEEYRSSPVIEIRDILNSVPNYAIIENGLGNITHDESWIVECIDGALSWFRTQMNEVPITVQIVSNDPKDCDIFSGFERGTVTKIRNTREMEVSALSDNLSAIQMGSVLTSNQYDWWMKANAFSEREGIFFRRFWQPSGDSLFVLGCDIQELQEAESSLTPLILERKDFLRAGLDWKETLDEVFWLHYQLDSVKSLND